jgi:SAM-dependent methyltransferase
MLSLDQSFGRKAFGASPADYHAARPPYPEATWLALRERGNLGAGIDILEIGAGTGLATTQLLARDPSCLVAIEPDARLADFMRTSIVDARLQLVTAPFETAKLPLEAFDLVASATAFHWLDAGRSLRRIHGLLRPGGAVALWWNVFGDASRPDPFHEATAHLFAGQCLSPSAGREGKPPYALDAEMRIRELSEAGFAADPPQFVRWVLDLDPWGVRNLYATHSNVAALPPDDRDSLLDSLVDIATSQFAGRVERKMTTAIYTARRD